MKYLFRVRYVTFSWFYQIGTCNYINHSNRFRNVWLVSISWKYQQTYVTTAAPNVTLLGPMILHLSFSTVSAFYKETFRNLLIVSTNLHTNFPHTVLVGWLGTFVLICFLYAFGFKRISIVNDTIYILTHISDHWSMFWLPWFGTYPFVLLHVFWL